MIRSCAALLVLGTALPATAQVRAQLSGFVHDRSGLVVREVAVSVLNLDNGIRRTTRTNGEGFFAVSSLAPGQYKVTVRKEGFQTVARTGVALGAFDATRIDFLLEPGSLHQEVTVSGTVSMSNTTDAGEKWTTSRLPAEYLPVNGRGLQALIDLAPGVLTTPATGGEAGQFSANGQRPATNYFTVDGIGANNGVSGGGLPGQFSGAALPGMTAIGSLHNLVTLGELEEMRIGTSTYAPEFGRLPGAQIAVSTRSGSNDLHGEFFGSFRHRRLGATDAFARAAGFDSGGTRMHNVGATLSGPLLRNRTFFHVATEHIRLRQPAAFLMVVPSSQAREAAPSVTRAIVQAFPLPNGPNLSTSAALHTAHSLNPSSVDSSAVRLDHALGTLGSAFVRYHRAPSSAESGYASRSAAHFNWQTLTTGFVVAPGPRLTLDGRLGFGRNRVRSEWLPGAIEVDLQSMLPRPAGEGQRLYGIGIRGVGQLLTGDSGRSHQDQWNTAGSASFTAGRHEIRAGIDYLRLSPFRDAPITSVSAVYDSLDRLVFGAIPTYNFAQTGGGRSRIETVSLFFQDTWHATPTLNITWGLRQEITPAPAYVGPISAGGEVIVSPNPVPTPFGLTADPAYLLTPNWKTRANQMAPRIGLAWRPAEQWVLRAGAGLFYDLGFSSAVDLVNGQPYNRFRSALPSLATTNFEQVVQYGFAGDLTLPRTAHWNVTIERLLGRDAAISAGYVAALGTGLLRREGYTDTRLQQPRLVLATNNGESSYHSLQVRYRSRDIRGVLGTISYTWSHAIDNGSWDSASYLVFSGANDRGSANFDVRHNFQAALAYDLGRSVAGKWARGWTVSGALRLRTGFPIDVVTTEHPFGLGFDNDRRPDLVAGVPVWIGDRLNPNAFARPAGIQGTLGRNAIRGHGLGQLDLALTRSFVITERMRIQLRAEAYNVSNSTHLGDPVRVLSSPMFGLSPSLASLMLGTGRPNGGLTPAFQSGGPRAMQLGLTLRF